MTDELEFRRNADKAIDALTKRLFAVEVEVQNGVLNIVFEEPPGKFVITPNAPVQQIWISALSTSFKLDWNEPDQSFYLPKTGEPLNGLVARLIAEHMDIDAFTLA